MNSRKVLRGTVRGMEDISMRKGDEDCQLEFERWSEEFLILFYLTDGERRRKTLKKSTFQMSHIKES